MELHERLSWARERAGLSQADVARHFDISREAVSQWEAADSGKKKVSRPMRARFAQLATLYGVDLHWLLTGDGDPDGTMTRDEIGLLARYRGLSEDKREAALRIIEALDGPPAAPASRPTRRAR